MRRIFYSLFILVTLASAVSCSYDDKSTYADYSKKDFSLDTTGVDLRQYVEFGETFTMSPKINYENFDESKFTYQWDVTLKPETSNPSSSTTSCTSFNALYKTISTEKDLVWQADNNAATNPYKLRLTIVNEANGQKLMCAWYIYVNAPTTKGFMVAYSANGSTSDLALIFEPAFNDAVDAVNVHTKFYSEGNGKEFPGIIYNMQWKQDYSNMGLVTDYLYLNALAHIEQFGIQSQKTYRQDGELYFDYPSVKPLKDAYLFAGHAGRYYSGQLRLYNDGGLHVKQNGNSNGDAGAKFGMCYYGLRAFAEGRPGAAGDAYDCDPVPPIAEGRQNWAYFDQKGMRFAKVATGTEKTLPTYIANTDGIPQFNPDVLKDWRPIYGGPGGTSSSYFFLMKKGNEYALAIMNTSKYQKWIPLTEDVAPELDKAVSFISPSNQSVLFYGTSTGKLYSLYADSTSGTATFRMEKDFGAEVNCLKFVETLWTTISEWDEQYLMAATTTGQSNGTLHLIKLDNIGTGHIKQSEPIKSYNVPGKIYSITNIE